MIFVSACVIATQLVITLLASWSGHSSLTIIRIERNGLSN